MQTLIKGKKPGDAVSLTYYRQGKEHTAKAKLAKGAPTTQGVRRPQPLRLENGEWKPFNVPNGLGLGLIGPCRLQYLRELLDVGGRNRGAAAGHGGAGSTRPTRRQASA